MKAIRKYIVVDSDTICIPELKQFRGKRIELTLTETESMGRTKGENRMRHFFAAAGKVKIDEDSIYQLREESKL